MTADRSTAQSHFLKALPAVTKPPTWAGGAIAEDLARAVTAGLLPPEARFWIRTETQYARVRVRLVAWPTSPLRTDYVEALMERLRIPTPNVDDPRLLNPLVDEIHTALHLVTLITERYSFSRRKIAVQIDARHLINVAEFGIRQECDPRFAADLHRAHECVQRLGKNVVRSICGESGIEGCTLEALQKLLTLDAAATAAGRSVIYDRHIGQGWRVRTAEDDENDARAKRSAEWWSRWEQEQAEIVAQRKIEYERQKAALEQRKRRGRRKNRASFVCAVCGRTVPVQGCACARLG